MCALVCATAGNLKSFLSYLDSPSIATQGLHRGPLSLLDTFMIISSGFCRSSTASESLENIPLKPASPNNLLGKTTLYSTGESSVEAIRLSR